MVSIDHNFSMSTNGNNTGANHDADRQQGIDFANRLVDIPLIVSRQRKCGCCGEFGHNRRSCPHLKEAGQFLASVEHQIKKID